MPIISELGLRLKDYHELKASWGYMLLFRPAHRKRLQKEKMKKEKNWEWDKKRKGR